jgi:transcriptional regulator with XRE-family HTH domain
LVDNDRAGSRPAPDGLHTFADRLSWVIAQATPPGRKPYSSYEVADLVVKVTGETVSHNAIWKLCNGRAANPTMRLISALARTFSVPAGFFFGEEPLPDASACWMLALIRDTGITSDELLAFAGLPGQARQAISDFFAKYVIPAEPPPKTRRRPES